MKKILTIALVALLAASSVFAGLSGQAYLNLGYNSKTGAYGFSNGKSFSLALDIAEETNEAVAEGDVHAGVKATMAVKAADRIGTNGSVYADGSDIGLGVFFSLKEAYVEGQDWKVAITGTQSGPDFAKSAIDSQYSSDKWTPDDFGNQVESANYIEYTAKTSKVSVYKAPGVTVTYKDWKVAAGFAGGKASKSKSETVTIDGSEHDVTVGGAPDYFNYHLSVFTPEITLAEGMTVKAAAVASGIKNATSVAKLTIGEETYEFDAVYNIYGEKVSSALTVYDPSKNYDAFGASVEGAYTSDAFSGKLAVDFGMKKAVNADEFALILDATANAVVSGFTVDAYYQYGKNAQYVSAQVKGDLNEFDVPVVVTVYGKDVLNDKSGQKLGGEVSATVEAFTVTAGGNYKLSTKELEVSGSVKYAAEKFTAKAGATFSKTLVENGAKQLYANASVESDSIIPGATLKLAYGPITEDKKTYYETVTNLLDIEKTNYGKVDLSCTIKF